MHWCMTMRHRFILVLVATELAFVSAVHTQEPAERERDTRSASDQAGVAASSAGAKSSRLLRSEEGARAMVVSSDAKVDSSAEDQDVYIEGGHKTDKTHGGNGGHSVAVDSDGSSNTLARSGMPLPQREDFKGVSSRKLIAHSVEAEEDEEDGEDEAPQDCEYGDWERWSECSNSCGGGSRHRTRSVEQEGENGGNECKDSEKAETEDCNSHACPVDCAISNWQDWSRCLPDCSGQRSRLRTVIQAATHGGEACGETKQEESCDGICTDCEFQDWSAWQECPVTCAGGQQSRRREVEVPATNGGKDCVGNKTESKVCKETACPVDCDLDDWNAWSSCEPYCSGNTTRQRRVKSSPSHGGQACGAEEETKTCTNFFLNCRWHDWSPWTSCSVPCGGGKMHRSRDQTLAMPEGGHANAASLLEEEPVKVFGFELKVNRRCDEVHQEQKGLTLAKAKKQCQEDESCAGLYDPGCDGQKVHVCTVDFHMQPENASCSYTKKEIGGGAVCEGDGFESKDCNTQPCPVDCSYGDWTNWTSCEPFCLGRQTRSREVLAEAANGGQACAKEDLQEENACMNECRDCQWEEWTEWDTCTVSCGGGTQQHRRGIQVTMAGGGTNCTGPSSEEQPCNGERCPVDCVLLDWTEWTECAPYCSGEKNRTRTVMLEAVDGGQACGPLLETKECGNFCMDCQVAEWSTWSSCSSSCRGGWSIRSRSEVYYVKARAGAAQPQAPLLSPPSLLAFGYEKKLNFRCSASSLGALAGAPNRAEATCSADAECEALYDEGCHGVLTVCKKGVSFEHEAGSCTYSKKEIGQGSQGQACDGNSSQAVACNTQNCPVDCKNSNFTV
ncbi:Hemicentin-1 (Fibulin-6) (FIBL-6) [Durusdinium trenchii]|uniref:Hemicentin-1 (Fibulin-6) (FIBL-6) n=1 Tax=Durusdinium trenchii TaxID=1381693 RepID=A0ABP0KJ05_9DINO